MKSTLLLSLVLTLLSEFSHLDGLNLTELEQQVINLEKKYTSYQQLLARIGYDLATNTEDIYKSKLKFDNQLNSLENSSIFLNNKIEQYYSDANKKILKLKDDLELDITQGRVCHNGENNFNNERYNGERIIEIKVGFGFNFVQLPQVFISTSKVDMHAWLHDGYEITTKSIQFDSFVVKFRTWSNAAIYSQCADWIAFGKKQN